MSRSRTRASPAARRSRTCSARKAAGCSPSPDCGTGGTPPHGGDPLETFTTLTRTPYAAVAPVHDRSPQVLPPELFGPWLDAALTDPEGVTAVLAEAGECELMATAVSIAVNSPRNDRPVLIEPLA